MTPWRLEDILIATKVHMTMFPLGLSSKKNAMQAMPLRPKVTISSLPVENLSEIRPKIGRSNIAAMKVQTVY